MWKHLHSRKIMHIDFGTRTLTEQLRRRLYVLLLFGNLDHMRRSLTTNDRLASLGGYWLDHDGWQDGREA